MWTNAVAAMGAAVLGSSISTGAKYLADVSGAKEMYEGFAKTGTGQWFDSIFSSKGVQGTLKSVSTDLIKQGFGLDPRNVGNSEGTNRIKTGTDSFSARNKIGQAGGQTAKFALGSRNDVRSALQDVRVSDRLAGWVKGSGTTPMRVIEPSVQKSGKASFKSGVIVKAS